MRLYSEDALEDSPLSRLYDEWGPRLYRYALLVLGNAAAAEDAVQETFLHLTRVAGRRAPAMQPPYAIRAVRNQCFSMLRRRRLALVDTPVLEAVAPDASEEERLMIEQALRELPIEQREVVFLRTFEGCTFQEIATVCDISINTAASRYRYALANLRRLLSPSGEFR